MSLAAAGDTALPASWRIRLPVFEGPLDLLLELVKLHEVEITEIPVAAVCDQFHEYLGLAERLDLDLAADYLYEAALLIHLKSRLLLPRTEEEAEESGEDPRQELVERLLEYRRIKEASQSLAELDSVRLGVWTRRPQPLPEGDEPEEETIDLGEVSLYDLLGALREVLDRYDREHPPALRLRGESFSVREQLRRLLDRLERDRPFDLLELLRGASCRAEAVAGFLAVLELARLDLVRCHQSSDGEIVLHRTSRAAREEELEAIQA